MCEEYYEVGHVYDALFQGNVLSISLFSISPINYQSCDVQRIYLEYADKMIILEHEPNKEVGSIHTVQAEKTDSLDHGQQIVIKSDDTIT